MSPTIKNVLLAVQITVAADLLVLNLGAVVVAPAERIVTPALEQRSPDLLHIGPCVLGH